MLELPNVTLCAVDTSHHVLTNLALQHCNNEVKFAKTIFITDKPQFVNKEWECHQIKPFADYREFNHYTLKNLYYHVETDFVLVVQFDGFVLNPDQWTDEFFTYDYIGAPWPTMPKEFAVGTGGFSLRSRKLLKALQDERVVLGPDSWNSGEDYAFCVSFKSYLRVHHGIEIAPVELAERFAFEKGDHPQRTFGFHGLPILSHVYGPEITPFVIDNFQPYLLRNAITAQLAVQYAERGQPGDALRLLKRIAEHQNYDETYKKLVERNAPQDMIASFRELWGKLAA